MNVVRPAVITTMTAVLAVVSLAGCTSGSEPAPAPTMKESSTMMSESPQPSDTMMEESAEPSDDAMMEESPAS
jgi:ABC-type uncharacterized transport system auxiliary subunit